MRGQVFERLTRAILLGLIYSAGVSPVAAKPPSPEPVAIVGYQGDAMEPFLSRDGRMLFFNNRNDPVDLTDLHWAERVDGRTFRYRGRVRGGDRPGLDGVPTLSAAGRLCFVTLADYAQTLATIRCGTWSAGEVSDAALQRDVSVHVPGRLMFDVEISAAGDRLIVSDGLFRGGGVPAAADLMQARWADGAFHLLSGDQAMFARINTPALEYAAGLSADSLALAFTRMNGRPPFARFSLWLARRSSPEQPFGAPVRLMAAKGFVEAPTFAPDGETVYYHRLEGGRYAVWRVALPPPERPAP